MRAPRAGRRRGSAVHDGLVGARALVGTPYLDDPVLRAEYARDIAPRTEAALARVLAELYDRGAVGGARPTRAIDLGAGTGAAGRALRAWFGEPLEVVAVDAVAGPGVLRADLSRELPAVGGRFDVVVAAHLLNELYVDLPPAEAAAARARRVLAWSETLLAPAGNMILVEPALRETSRALLEVRDRVIAAGLEVLAPCSWTGSCPALERERDWCHDAAATGGGARVDFSYLVLRAAGPRVQTDRALFRVVSDLMHEKGRLRLFGCGPSGRHALVRLDRHATATNGAFEAAERGDVLRIEGTELAGDGLRLTAESIVTRR